MAIYTVHGGHAAQENSFSGASGLCSESIEDRKIKDAVIKYLRQASHTVYDCTVDSGSSQSNIITLIKNKINSHKGVTANISIHLNCYNGSANGTECCIYSSTGNAAEIGKRICNNISSAGFTNRGNKIRTNLGVLKGITNGGANILVESFFCDSAKDYNLYKNIGADAFGKLIAEAILNTNINNNIENTSSAVTIQIGTVQLYDDNGSNAQKWKKYENNDGSVSFENLATGLFLDLAGAANKSGSIVQVYSKNGSNAQKWKIKSNRNSKRIVSMINEGLSLDVDGNSSDNGTKIQVYSNNNTKAQEWNLIEISKNIYKIINSNGKVLDVAGGVACGRNDNYSKSLSYKQSNNCDLNENDKLIQDGLIHANNFSGCGTNQSQIKKARIMVLQRALNLDYIAGLKEDGVIGNKTLNALGNHYVKIGETQYLVTAVEILLMLKGYDPCGVECPGKFGNNLYNCIKSFQRDNGLTSDGVAGSKTVKLLIN